MNEYGVNIKYTAAIYSIPNLTNFLIQKLVSFWNYLHSGKRQSLNKSDVVDIFLVQREKTTNMIFSSIVKIFLLGPKQ